ncbi:g3247 [Coccomyxa viridis]|uniref:G3247 protein n=1 Tax=Coccomyxa viridis TaxID=1274662 RepID=A0ABP1FSH0_9CHLO
MLEERDQDLEHLSERGSRVPSGLPLELQDWLRDYIAAKSLRRSLDRMSLLLHKQEKEASQKASLPPGHHPIQASAGSVRTEGELQTPVVKQSPNFKEATSTVALIPQAKSITETLGAEHLRQRRVKARGRRQDKHAGMSPTSVLDVGDELVT